MANLTELRKAQQLVCESLFPEYVKYNTEYVELHGERKAPLYSHVEDKVWDGAQSKTLPTLEHSERQFVESPTVANALTFWECAITQ